MPGWIINKNEIKIAKFLLARIGACEVAKNPQIILIRANQYIHEINRHFDETLNSYGQIVFASNQLITESYTLKDMLLQPDKSDFIMSMIK